MPITRYLLWVVLSGLAVYGVEAYSFALAHSAGGVLAVIFCPGILIVVANLLMGIPGWIAAAAINCLYYEWLWRLAKKRSAT